MSAFDIESVDVLEYIPQRAPIVMIDKLLFSDETKTVSSLLVLESNIFCNDGFLSENGMIENIAQTAAAGFGYFDKSNNKEVSLGYIASIKDVFISKLPCVNDTINTETTFRNQIMDYKIIDGKILLNNIEIASCEMRIFVKP